MLTVTLGLYTVFGMKTLNRETDNLYNVHLKGVGHVKDAYIHISTVVRARNAMLLETELSHKNRQIDNMKKGIEEFENSIELFKEIATIEDKDKLIADLMAVWEEFKAIEQEIVNLGMENKIEEANVLREESRALSDQIAEGTNNLVELQDQAALKSYEDADVIYQRGRNISGIILVGSFIIAVAITYYMSNTITKPIMKIEAIAKTIADGDLTDEEIQVKNKDEIGRLANSFNTMTDGLRSLIQSITETAEAMAASSEQLTATSQQSALASEEVAKTIEEIARGASEQAMNTEEGASMANSLGMTIEKDLEYKGDLNEASKRVNEFVSDGLVEIENLIRISDETTEETEKVYGDIIKTNESARKIEAASNVIASIADQTNLLALNAAIEAARAGDAGRGFAVVAEEIRKLAEESMASTKTIDSVVQELQTNSNSSVQIMNRVAEIMKKQFESVQVSKSKYLLIDGAMKEANKAIEKLNISSKEVEELKNDILETLQSLAAIAEENSAATQEVSASMEEQAASAEEISSSSLGLSELANNLYTVVNRFKI